MSELSKSPQSAASAPLALAFALSGAAAIIYQVCWQRVLFVAVGVDIESVTLIVSAFMLGLGVGAIVGGMLADALPARATLLFACCEIGTACFGIVSVDAALAVGNWTSSASRAATALACFSLFLLPTLLMGATLPLLVAQSARKTGNVGASTGALYAANTLGAAVGAFLVGFVLLYWLDLRQAVWVAVCANLLAVAALACPPWRNR